MELKHHTRSLILSLANILLGLILVHQFVTSENVLMTTDAAISSANRSVQQCLDQFQYHWNEHHLLGRPRGSANQLASFLRGIMPGIIWNNLAYPIACLLGALAFIGIMPRRYSWSSIALGGIVACWVGSNFTLIHAGHFFKPYVVLIFLCSLMVRNVSTLIGAILYGGCVGLMFAQQPDVAMLFAIFSGAYFIFKLWHQLPKPVSRPAILNWLKILVTAAAVVLLFAAGPLLSGYRQHVKNTVQVQTETPEQKWNYVTQWSFPPSELIDLIAPNYTGIRTGEPAGPYWGKTGRSANWDETRQGYMNFRMESVYIGFMPVALAIFALIVGFRTRKRNEIIFWVSAASVALLLAFGRFFPLYRLFFALPVVNNIRNPNKFLQIFQVCIAILAAYGIHFLLAKDTKANDKTSESNPVSTRVLKRFTWSLMAVTGLLTIAALIALLTRANIIATFTGQGWPDAAARSIASNQIRALWHAAIMALVLSGIFSFRAWKPSQTTGMFPRNALGAIIILMVAGDAVLLSKHYVKEMPRSYIEANALTEFLTENLDHQRVAFLRQDNIYNIWLTYLLPYNNIPTFNFAQMPRMPADYQALLQAGGKNPLAMWAFSGVKYLLAPTALKNQVPPTMAEPVFQYDVTSAPGNNIRVTPSPTGQHAVFELKQSIPRFALMTDRNLGDTAGKTALERLSNPQSSPVAGTLVPDAVEVTNYRSGLIKLTVDANQPSILRIAERYDPDWKATINGKPAQLENIDFICLGLPLDAGKHEIVIKYSPSQLFFYMQVLGYIILISAIIWHQAHKRKSSMTMSAP